MQTDTTEDAYDWDKLRNDIIIYQNELEKCDKNFEEMAHKAYSTAEMVESSEQYSKRAEDHKKALSAYIQAAYDISNIIYQTADVCYPRCGTMFIVIGNNTAAHKARTIVEDYIRALDARANL